jgi:hypothetical protein
MGLTAWVLLEGRRPWGPGLLLGRTEGERSLDPRDRTLPVSLKGPVGEIKSM